MSAGVCSRPLRSWAYGLGWTRCRRGHMWLTAQPSAPHCHGWAVAATLLQHHVRVGRCCVYRQGGLCSAAHMRCARAYCIGACTCPLPAAWLLTRPSCLLLTPGCCPLHCHLTTMWVQGDKEKAAGLPVSPLFDRDKPGVTKSQGGCSRPCALQALYLAGHVPCRPCTLCHAHT